MHRSYFPKGELILCMVLFQKIGVYVAVLLLGWLEIPHGLLTYHGNLWPLWTCQVMPCPGGLPWSLELLWNPHLLW